MPYRRESGGFEHASRIGHVPIANSTVVREAMTRWVVPAIDAEPPGLRQRCTAIDNLPGVDRDPKFAVAFDGSPQEVPARADYPSVRIGYLQVAGVYVDLGRFFAATEGPLVDPRRLAAASHNQIVNAVLPGSNVHGAESSPRENWRAELYSLFTRQGVLDFGDPVTLLEALFHLHGGPLVAANSITVGRCPYKELGCNESEISVALSGRACPACGRSVWPTDVLRTHEEFDEEGSNVVPLTRLMGIVERLLLLIYLSGFAQQLPGVLADAAFITDGPLAFYGTAAPMKRRMVRFLEILFSTLATQGIAPPLLVGIEKSGIFVDHANAIAAAVPNGHVVFLDDAYIRERVKRRAAGRPYGADEFYGRRFLYKTRNGRMLVVTVPRIPSGQPYGEAGCENISDYPTLRATVKLLDRLGTRLYADAVIPVALAHSAAALPLGTGQDVLRILAQDILGLPRTGRERPRGSSF